MQCVVVKVGGSLLSDANLAKRARGWLENQEGGACVFVVGCGPLADVLRSADQAHQLDPAFCHWSCIDLMDASAGLFAEIAGFNSTSQWDALRRNGDSSESLVFRPARFLRRQEPALPGDKLPVGWSVTSDSIAARIAQLLNARLVLWKSTSAADGDLAQLAESGFVDAHFPTAAKRLTEIQFVNLRAAPPTS